MRFGSRARSRQAAWGAARRIFATERTCCPPPAFVAVPAVVVMFSVIPVSVPVMTCSRRPSIAVPSTH